MSETRACINLKYKVRNKINTVRQKIPKTIYDRTVSFLFELGSNIVTLMTIAEYGKYTDIEEDKPSRTVGNRTRHVHHVIIAILIEQMFHTFNLNIHYFINCFLPFSAYGVNIIIIQLQKAINIIDYLEIFDQSEKFMVTCQSI